MLKLWNSMYHWWSCILYRRVRWAMYLRKFSIEYTSHSGVS